MHHWLPSTPAASYPTYWALQTADSTEVSYLVIVGLGIIAVVWILAGLWLIHVGEVNHRVRR